MKLSRTFSEVNQFPALERIAQEGKHVSAKQDGNPDDDGGRSDKLGPDRRVAAHANGQWFVQQ